MSTTPEKNLHIRPITDKDLPFLRTLYASTRAAELATTNWTDEQKRFFTNSQFQLQHNYYQQQHTSAQFHLITANDCSIGRLYYYWSENNLHIIDIALMPEHQHQGTGGTLIHDLMEEASTRNSSMSLQVKLDNPARDWYLRLGFVAGENDGVYQKMRWTKTTTEKHTPEKTT